MSSTEKSRKLLMGMQNVAELRREEDGFSRKSKRERPKAVRDFPFGCGTQFMKGPTGTKPVDSKTSDDPVMMTNPKKYSPQKFKRVSAVRSFPAGFSKNCLFPAVEPVAMADVPTKHGHGSVSNVNALLCGDGRNGYSGVVCRDIVPRIGNSSAAAAANTSKLANTAALNGARDVKPISSFHEGGEMVCGRTSAMRQKVVAVLQLYRDVVERLRKENKRKSPWENRECIYMSAAKHLKLQGKWLNSSKTLGSVPGVEIGDKFLYRAEMNVIGLHCQPFKGIDYMRCLGKDVATSIVASGRYCNYKSDDILIYSGSGGNPSVRGKQPLHDQKLKWGNLALKNSMDRKTPVRVIYKVSLGLKRFFYDGLYLVEKFWQERGETGKLVFKFMLRRTKQPLLNMEVVNMVKWESSKDQALLMNNLDHGQDAILIKRENMIDDEEPPLYVDGKDFVGGCDCVDGCSNSEDCSCKIKNGGKVPYDYNECMIGKKLCIYECTPSCKCYTSCINRVSQRCSRFQLEEFLTRTKRWGLRSKSYIPRGRFVCEIVKEAQQMANANATTQSHIVGRFIINHSSEPNLFAKEVLNDHLDARMPHIMLFAAKDIPPLQELTYDYNAQLSRS